MKGKNTEENKGGPLWKMLQKVEGDKVIMIIILLLLMASFLAIFSSTPMLPTQDSRLQTMTEHGIVALLGIGIMFVLYHIKIDRWRGIAMLGFIGSFIMLAMLLLEVNIPGVIRTQKINGAVRNFIIAGFQVHVFEIVKVAMLMYLAWAMDALKRENSANEEEKEARMVDKIADNVKWLEFLRKPFWRRAFYIYAPTLIIGMMIFFGSGSSAIFVCAILIAAMLLGDIPFKDIFLAFVGVVFLVFSLVTVYKVSDGRLVGRVGTMISRMKADYDINRLEGLKGDEYNNMVDTLSQPVSALIAVHEGGVIGKGIGNSTQKYRVQNIYGDYMFSFLVEEYGLIGGIFILILYVSLLARSSILARMCSNDFAKYMLGGMAILIAGQAFMHIMVNVGIGPMTGQTLPLISHGASAFVVFCVAFGFILSVSRMAKKKIETAEILTEGDKNNLEKNIEKAEKTKD